MRFPATTLTDTYKLKQETNPLGFSPGWADNVPGKRVGLERGIVSSLVRGNKAVDEGVLRQFRGRVEIEKGHDLRFVKLDCLR